MNKCIDYAGQSDTGRIRIKNEDNWRALPEHGLYVVADGIGGMPAGEVASMLVTEVLPEVLMQRLSDIRKLTQTEIIQRLQQAIIDLSNRIRVESQKNPKYLGMGSTLVMLLLTEEYNFIAHLGDSRAYIQKDGLLEQMTKDHTLVQHLLITGIISQQQLAKHPAKNQLVQYVGMTSSPKPDIICVPRVVGERRLLCSDGLSDMLSLEEINQLLLQNSSPEVACRALIKAANQAGGKDNISVIVID